MLNAAELYLLRATENRLLKSDVDAVANILAFLRASLGGSAHAAEETFEDIAHVAEVAEEIEVPEIRPESFGGMAEAVVSLTPSGIGKYFVSFIDLLELLCSAVVSVPVGVVLEGELSESPLYLRSGC
jgi:hypothetical protein